jgi:hypothetical protein
MQTTLLDPFEIRAPETNDTQSIDVEVEFEEEPKVLPPTRGPRVWVSED